VQLKGSTGAENKQNLDSKRQAFLLKGATGVFEEGIPLARKGDRSPCLNYHRYEHLFFSFSL
jgi:hypothetical protein